MKIIKYVHCRVKNYMNQAAQKSLPTPRNVSNGLSLIVTER